MFGAAGGDGLPMMYGGDGWMWGGWILMSLVMVVFWALVITAIVLAFRYLTGGSHPTQASPVPLGRQKTCWPNASPEVRSTTRCIGSV